MIGDAAHAAILRQVATAAVVTARVAWKRARKSPTETRVRAAYRACVLADRMLRKAALVTPEQTEQLVAEAILVGATAEELKIQLARIVEGRLR